MFKKIIQWFIKKAWPVILKFLIKYSNEIVEFIFTKMREVMEQKRKQQQQDEMAKAQDHYQKAKEESDPELKKQYVEIAQKHQERANSFEDMMKKWNEYLDSLKSEVISEITNKTSELKAEDIFETNKEDKFDLKNKTSYLQIGTTQK